MSLRFRLVNAPLVDMDQDIKGGCRMPKEMARDGDEVI